MKRLRRATTLVVGTAMVASYLAFPALPAQAAQFIKVDPGIRYQTMDGWGTKAGSISTGSSKPTRDSR